MSGRAIAKDARTFVQNIAPSVDREADDFYPTPPEATISLLAIEDFGPYVWEPACGDGAISNVLVAAGHSVVSSDLVDRGFGTPRVDFLMERTALAPCLITNPPFKLAEQFVQHALAIGVKKVAMLLRLAWLEGVDRKRKVYDSTPIARVHVSSRRLTMLRGGTDAGKGGGSMIAFAWFVWEAGHVGDPVIRFFDWADYAPDLAKEIIPAAAGGDDLPLFK